MAELGRVAQAAIRSRCSLLRTAPIRSHPGLNFALASPMSTHMSGGNHLSTISTPRSTKDSERPSCISLPLRSASPSRAQQRSYAFLNNNNKRDWSNPARAPRSIENIAKIGIRKPNSAAYDIATGGLKEDENETRDKKSASALGPDDLDICDISDINSSKEPSHEARAAPRPHIRMVPRTGRTIYVKNNVDVARSFKLLAVQVSQNRLRSDFYMQRWHERPGIKRKRLKSERWQKRFKRGFKAAVSRVRELTSQGW